MSRSRCGNSSVTVPCGFRSARSPCREVVDRRHVREHVVADDEVGAARLFRELRGERRAEERAADRDAQRLGRGRRACRRLDAEARDTRGDEVPEQVAVVGADLDHETPAVESEARADRLEIRFRVRAPRLRGRREVRVVVAEELAAPCVVLGLHESARMARVERQRVGDLRRVQVGRAEVRIRRRREAQVDEHVVERLRAVTAVHAGMPWNDGASAGSRRSRSESPASRSTGSGQATAIRASSHATPPSDPGACGAVCR